MSVTKILETFIRSFPSSFNRKYVHMVACTVVFVGAAHFVFNASPARAAIFFICWRRLALARWNRENESSGSEPVYWKQFLRGPHNSKNNFFEIKISRPTPWESLSALLWLLSAYILGTEWGRQLGKSLIYGKNSNGPNIVPWGIPHLTVQHSEGEPLSTHFWVRLSKKEENHLWKTSVIP